MAAVTGRTNTITGVQYRDDPRIVAWQRSSEPRGFARADPDVRWVGRAGRFLHAGHVAIAHAVHKPIVVEEFGVSRDSGRYAPDAPVTSRDQYRAIGLEALHHLASEPEHPVVARGNLWSWSGEGRPVAAGGSWHPGHPLIGDPPPERQGRYSIHDRDSSTAPLLRTDAGRMSAFGRAASSAATSAASPERP